jgi:hypothetical protein
MKTYNGETLVLSRNRRILILYSFPLAHYFVIGLQKVKNPGAEGRLSELEQISFVDACFVWKVCAFSTQNAEH